MTEDQIQAKQDEIDSAATCEDKLALSLALNRDLKALLLDCYGKPTTKG